jgi:hypothetical protein
MKTGLAGAAAAAWLVMGAVCWAQSAVPAGAYQCQVLANGRYRPSTMGELHVGGGGYAAPAMRGSGRYEVVAGASAVQFSSGPLAGRVATLGSANGNAVLRFSRGDNGPRAESGDTLCFHRRAA